MPAWPSWPCDDAGPGPGPAIAAGVEFARELGNLPPNYCTPAYLADVGVKFVSEHRVPKPRSSTSTRWKRWAWARCWPWPAVRPTAASGRAEVEQWRRRQARAGRQGHHLRYRWRQPEDPGGIEEMKYDMCGNVIGTFVAAVKAKLPLNLVVVCRRWKTPSTATPTVLPT